MAYENEQTGTPQPTGTTPGSNGGSRVRDHLKAAGTAAGDAARERREQASQWARERRGEAGEWARSQLTGLQSRVESDPQRATLWALGVGLVVGVILASLMRSTTGGSVSTPEPFE
jgi:hypothetical protein